MTDVLREDCAYLARRSCVPWDFFDGKRIVVTGATGLIGSTLVNALCAREQCKCMGMRIIALVRNVEKAKVLFSGTGNLEIVMWDAAKPLENLEGITKADIIIHCANMTESSSFVDSPVEVIQTTLGGAQAMLMLAKRTGARLCLLSTMETYGEVSLAGALLECQGGFIDPMVVRNCYPEAKRLGEALCAAYSSEYGVDAVVIRLSQSFGPGVSYDDSRVFAYFARCVQEKKDIVLLTDGSKRNSYLYTADAVSAILAAASRGESGRAYNAANDDTFCSVLEMAHMVCREFGDGKISVRIEIDDDAAQRFRKGSVLRLDTSALRGLGWSPLFDLRAMYQRMMASWEANE